MTGVPSKPQSCLGLWGDVSPSHTHVHTHTRTHTHTHSCLQMYLSIQPLSEKASALFTPQASLLPLPSASLPHTTAELSLCDPVMSLSPVWGMALQPPTFTSDLRSPHLGPLNGLLGVRHLPHPRRGGFQLSLLTHVGLNLLLPHELPSHFPLASTEDSWGHSPP